MKVLHIPMCMLEVDVVFARLWVNCWLYWPVYTVGPWHERFFTSIFCMPESFKSFLCRYVYMIIDTMSRVIIEIQFYLFNVLSSAHYLLYNCVIFTNKLGGGRIVTNISGNHSSAVIDNTSFYSVYVIVIHTVCALYVLLWHNNCICIFMCYLYFSIICHSMNLQCWC